MFGLNTGNASSATPSFGSSTLTFGQSSAAGTAPTFPSFGTTPLPTAIAAPTSTTTALSGAPVLLTSASPGLTRKASTPAPVLFGQPPSQPTPVPRFGGAKPTSLFGSPAAPAASAAPLFGSTATPTPAPSAPLFGAKPSATPATLFGATTSSPAPSAAAAPSLLAPAPKSALITTKPQGLLNGDTFKPIGDEVTTRIDANKPMDFSHFNKVIQKTFLELDPLVSKFPHQSMELNAYDSVIRESSDKLNEVTTKLEEFEKEKTVIQHNIAFATEQLGHLENGVAEMEKRLGLGDWTQSWNNGGADMFDSSYKTAADGKRQNILQMLLNVDAQLKDVEEGVDQVNKDTRTLAQEKRGVLGQDEKALTVLLRRHMEALEWLNQADADLSTQVAQLSLAARQ